MDEAGFRHETPGDYVTLLHLAVQRFEGETSVEQHEGEGVARFEGGHVYQGTFSRGFMDGAGVFTHTSGLKYEGDFVCNLPRGRGTYTWPDSSCYEGQVCNGVRNGWGTFKCAEGGVFYSGQWLLGKRHGKGTVYYNQERTSWYKGDWVDNNREGRGERRYPSGNTYSGEWKNNLRHGEGTMKWQNGGQHYAGKWQDGVHHGKGRHVWVLGAVDGSHYSQNNQYVGEFVAGRRHGTGIFLYASGAKYEGQWKDNKKHGQGKLTFEDGHVYEGEFLEDRMLTPNRQLTDNTPLGGTSDLVLDLEDLLKRFPEKTRRKERQQVEFVVLRHIAALRSIYSFYSRLGSTRCPDNTFPLSRMQLWRLLKDCNVHHHGFTLTQMNPFIQGAAGSSEDVRSPFTTFLFRNLVNCLVRVAYRVYSKDVPSQKNLLAACLSRLMTGNILPHATNVKGFLFRHSGVAAAALKHVEQSWEVYEAHCRISSTLTCRRLLWMFKDLRLLDDRLTPARFVEILTAESCDPTNLTSCLDLEMNFLEFVEVLLGCAEAKCLQACGGLKEDASGSGSGSDSQNTNSRAQQTESSSGEGAESQDVTAEVNETQQAAGKPEACGGEGQDVENGGMETKDDRLDPRIQTVDQFFNNFFFPAFDRQKILTTRLRQEAQKHTAVVKSQINLACGRNKKAPHRPARLAVRPED